MNNLLVEYTLFGSPKVHYITISKADLCGTATVLEQIAAWERYPQSACSEIRIIDLLFQ